MAYTTVNKSTDYFNTVLYEGNGATGRGITGVGHQPDFVWIKNRDATTPHVLTDSVRGATVTLNSNDTSADDTISNGLTAFGTDGFTIGGNGSFNYNNESFVSWNWKAGTTSGISTDIYSTITPTSYSFNATNGFSIVKYNGNGTAGAGVPHGLGVAPKMVIVKNTASSSTGWYCYHKDIGAGNVIYLNSNAGASSASTVWNGYNTDATNFYLGTNTGVNDNGTAHIAYCFAEKTGFSKMGSYVGNGSTNGTFIYTGFKPSWVIIKSTGVTENWDMKDNKINPFNEMTTGLRANTTGAEDTNTTYHMMDFLSNGIKLKGGDQNLVNGINRDYIFMAFGQSLVGSNNVPCTAR